MPTLTAAWVVPVSRPPIRRGWLAVRGDRIASVGEPGEALPPGEVVDFGDAILMPGLVNAHTHLELSHLAGRVDAGGGWTEWVRCLVAARSEQGPEAERRAAAAAIASLVQGGTVAVAEVTNGLGHLDLLEGSGLFVLVLHELIGWDPAKAPKIARGAEERVALARTRHPGLRVELAAHAPHSVSRALFGELVREGGPAALHLAESRTEVRFLESGDAAWSQFLAERGAGDVPFEPTGLRPVRYADSLGALRRGALAVHCVHVDEADAELLASRGLYVVLCPRSNRSLDVGLPPLPLLVDRGVRLCLGSDSLASAPDLDVLQDAALLRAEFPAVAPSLLVRMATLGGAEALDCAALLGSIEAGKRAALAVVPLPGAIDDPERYLLSGDARPRRARW
jgi:aminodeoxyfutalosine deaminase